MNRSEARDPACSVRSSAKGSWGKDEGDGGHCITPAHVLSIKAAAACFASLCIALRAGRSDSALSEPLTKTKEEQWNLAFYTCI